MVKQIMVNKKPDPESRSRREGGEMSRKGEEKHYVSRFALCPFYQYQTGERVMCDGSASGTRVMLVFMNREERNKYLDLYCECNYQACPVYEGLMKAWSEREGC